MYFIPLALHSCRHTGAPVSAITGLIGIWRNLANVMAVGVLTDRADIYNYAIRYLLNGAGNGQLKKVIYFIHPDGLGQLQESGRDQGHALLCVGLMGDHLRNGLESGG